MDCGKLKPDDIPRCPHCGGVLTMFFSPVDMLEAPALNYNGPVAVCRNDECPYYKRSFGWTRKTMGWNLGFRHSFICSSKDSTDKDGKPYDGEPISTRVTDNPGLFVNTMGEPWIFRRAEQVGEEQARLDAVVASIKQWNYALKLHTERVDEIEERPEALWSGTEIVVK